MIQKIQYKILEFLKCLLEVVIKTRVRNYWIAYFELANYNTGPWNVILEVIFWLMSSNNANEIFQTLIKSAYESGLVKEWKLDEADFSGTMTRSKKRWIEKLRKERFRLHEKYFIQLLSLWLLRGSEIENAIFLELSNAKNIPIIITAA